MKFGTERQEKKNPENTAADRLRNYNSSPPVLRIGASEYRVNQGLAITYVHTNNAHERF
jgi:hypothetical protein